MLTTPRANPSGWAFLELFQPTEATQMDLNIELLDQYIDGIIFGRSTWYSGEHGLVGDGSDETVALQDAVTALAAAGGGRLVLQTGFYHVSVKLTVPASVSIVGEGFVVMRLVDATGIATFIEVTGSSSRSACVISNIRFEATLSNTGIVFSTTGASTLIIADCTVNSADDELKGQLVKATSSTSVVHLVRCRMSMKGPTLIGMESLGEINTWGGDYDVPGNYNPSSAFIDATERSTHSGTRFTQLLSTVGCSFVRAHKTEMTGCRFNVTDSGAPNLTYAVKIVSGSEVTMSGNFYGGVTEACDGVSAADGSIIQLKPTQERTASGGGTVTLTPGYESYGIKYSGSSPTFALPQAKVKGQKLYLTAINVAVTPMGFGVTGYKFKASQPTPNPNTGASGLFVATDPTSVGGTLEWSQVGEWGDITT